MTSVPLTTRVEFVVELARRLHEYGTAAPRLEAAVSLVAQRLSLACDVLSTPTSITMSFSPLGSGDSSLAETTQVLRVPPGEVNLKSLCLVDEIADQVIQGDLDLGEGRRRLREVGMRKPSTASTLLTLGAYALASACVAAILLTGWAGVATAAVIGLLTGVTALSARARPNIAAAFEAISALLATTIATVVAVYLVPIQVRSVVVASHHSWTAAGRMRSTRTASRGWPATGATSLPGSRFEPIRPWITPITPAIYAFASVRSPPRTYAAAPSQPRCAATSTTDRWLTKAPPPRCG